MAGTTVVRVIDWMRVSRGVKSCVMCGSHDVAARWDNQQTVTVACHACRCIVRIEFEPADSPGVRGRIEPLLVPEDDDSPGDN
jgi:hypothetical protein